MTGSSQAPVPATPGAGPDQLQPEIIPDLFSAEECDRIEALACAGDLEEGLLAGRRVDPEMRRSQILWVREGPDTAWLYDRLCTAAAAANDRRYRFDLEARPETLQIAEYRAADTGHYSWHADRGASSIAAGRKLSVAVQLSAAEAYVGGDLIINPAGKPYVLSRARGQAVIFPAFTVHRVAPVFSGLRRSLVGWFGGPPFR